MNEKAPKVVAFISLANALIELGPQPPGRLWQGFVFWTMITCLYGSGTLGLVAVVREHERSWMLTVPTALIAVAGLNELLQGLVQLS